MSRYLYHFLTALSLGTIGIITAERLLVISLPASRSLKVRHQCRIAIGVYALLLALLVVLVTSIYTTSNLCFIPVGPYWLVKFYYVCVFIYIGGAVFFGPAITIALIARVRQAQRMRIEHDATIEKAEALVALELGAIAIYTALCVSLDIFWVTNGARRVFLHPV